MNSGVLENENTQIAEDWLEFLVAREACARPSREGPRAGDLQAKLQDLEQKLEALAKKQIEFRLSVDRAASSPSSPLQYCADFPASFVPYESPHPGHTDPRVFGLEGPEKAPQSSGGPAARRKGSFVANLFSRKS